MSGGLRFEVLGPLRLTRSDDPIKIGGPVQRRVLAALLAGRNRIVTDDRLVDEVWAGDPPPSARHLVQVYVSRLRDVFGSGDGAPRIQRDGNGYRLEAAPGTIDADVFLDMTSQAHAAASHDPQRAAAELQTALDLWRGRPFEDLADEMPMLRTEAAMLEERRAAAEEDRVDLELGLGHHDEMIPILQRLVDHHPFREHRWSQLMLALYRSGREAEALRTFARFSRMLGEELGIEPSHDLRRLEERILLQDPGLALEAPEPPSTLPIQLTSFVGRTAEMSELGPRLTKERLVTLVGVGGIGKTRLAVEVARAAIAEFPDGVWWVDLSAVTDPGAVAGRVAAGVGVGAAPGTAVTEPLIRSFSRRTALFVIDNCEQVADAVAELVVDLLRGCADVTVLTTSRVPLDVAGEVLWAVPPLDQPDPHDAATLDELQTADAVRLFVERAGAANRTFRLTAENAGSIRTLCRRLDGLPLAIEMAAARVAELAPAQIEEHLSDRFSLLHGPRHPSLPRHETLQAALDWSYTMLEAGAQETFDQLGVFAGSFDLPAAIAVTAGGAAVGAIEDLAAASLVTVDASGGEVARYRLLETVRAYALERLVERGTVEIARSRHAIHYLELLHEAGSAQATPELSGWLERIDAAYDEIRQALDWSLTNPGEVELGGLTALFEYWYRHGRPEEAGLWARRILDDPERPLLQQAAAHTAAGFSAVIAGDAPGSVHHADEAIRLCREAGDEEWLTTALFTRAQAALMVGDFATMVECGTEGLDLSSGAGSRWRRAQPLTVLGFAEWQGGGDLDRAAALLAETLPLYQELGDVTSQVVMALGPLSAIALQQGDVAAAEEYAGQAVAAGTVWDGSALSSLGDALAAKGDVPGAVAAYRRGLVRSLEVGLENWFRVNVRKLATMAFALGDDDRAAGLWGASTLNIPNWGDVIGQAAAAELRSRLGDGTFDRLAAEGVAWSHDRILAQAAIGPHE